MIVVEDLHGGDEELALRLGQQAFGGTDPYDPERPGPGDRRHVAAYLDGNLVGQVRRLAFGQWFGGRRLACAGISGVTVAPQARGRSLARMMLTESIERAAADGEVIAALFPTTAALYRSVGFEVAGWWIQQGVPMGELPRDDGTLAWERADVDDPRGLAVYGRMAPDYDGWLDPGAAFWKLRAMQARNDTKVNRYSYVGLRGGEPVASLQYAYGTSERAMYRLDVEGIYGVDGAAVRAALGVPRHERHHRGRGADPPPGGRARAPPGPCPAHGGAAHLAVDAGPGRPARRHRRPRLPGRRVRVGAPHRGRPASPRQPRRVDPFGGRRRGHPRAGW